MIQTAADGPCSADSIQNLPIPDASLLGKYKPNKNGDTIVLGLEGSANKVGVGVLKYSPPRRSQSQNGNGTAVNVVDEEPATYHILSNPRKTYIAPTGQGFLPKQTARHHQNHIVALIRAALSEAFPDEEHPETLISASESFNEKCIDIN
jgi:N6-L-threonylcarbamoyladenine synthase